MVGGWADWMARKREREGWLSRHGRRRRSLGGGRSWRKGASVSLPGIEESIRWWEPSATNASDALRHCTPTTEPAVYPPSARGCSLPAFSPPQLVQLPSHNPRMRRARTSSLLLCALPTSYGEMPRNCLNCGVGSRALAHADPKMRIMSAEFYGGLSYVCRSNSVFPREQLIRLFLRSVPSIGGDSRGKSNVAKSRGYPFDRVGRADKCPLLAVSTTAAFSSVCSIKMLSNLGLYCEAVKRFE